MPAIAAEPDKALSYRAAADPRIRQPRSTRFLLLVYSLPAVVITIFFLMVTAEAILARPIDLGMAPYFALKAAAGPLANFDRPGSHVPLAQIPVLRVRVSPSDLLAPLIGASALALWLTIVLTTPARRWRDLGACGAFGALVVRRLHPDSARVSPPAAFSRAVSRRLLPAGRLAHSRPCHKRGRS